ncbi:hypothetical protein ACXONO_08955 [Streptococcus thermophilus]
MVRKNGKIHDNVLDGTRNIEFRKSIGYNKGVSGRVRR